MTQLRKLLSGPTVIGSPLTVGQENDTRLRFREDDNGFTLQIGDDANVFTSRFTMRSGDHATEAHDLILWDGDGVTERFRWDESANRSDFNGPVRVQGALEAQGLNPNTDGVRSVGAPGASWLDVFSDEILDGLGVLKYDVLNAEFETAHRFLSTVRSDGVFTMGAPSTSPQFRFIAGTDIVEFQTGTAGDAFLKHMTFYNAAHSTKASDFEFHNAAGANILQWDQSAGFFKVGSTYAPTLDNTFDLATAATSFQDLFVFNIKDEAGTVVLDTSAAGVVYTRNATIVEDRTLLASASATIINNNNVLAALIADLQAIGLVA